MGVLDRTWFPLGLTALLLLKLELVFFPFRFGGWVAPPGNDPPAHLTFIEQLQASGDILGQSYPPLFHLLVLGVSNLTGIEPLSILTYGTPVLVILAGLAVSYLAWVVGGRVTALLVAALYLITSPHTLYNYSDGQYPQLLAGAILLPLLLALMLQCLRRPTAMKWFLVILAGLAIVATHSLTTSYLFVIIIIWLIALWLIPFSSSGLPRRQLGWFIALVLVIAGIGIVLSESLRELLFANLQGNAANYFGPTISRLFDQPDYPTHIGPFVYSLGLIGGLWLIIAKTKRPEITWLLVIWIVSLYLLSRWPGAGLPARFVRELAIPMAIVGGLLVEWLMRQSTTQIQRIGIWALFGYFVVINASQLNFPPRLSEGFFGLERFSRTNRDTALMLEQSVSQNAHIALPPAPPYWEKLSQRTLTVLTETHAEEMVTLRQTIDRLNITHLLITPKPEAAPPPESIFATYDAVAQTLNQFPDKILVRQFIDGSRLYRITPDLNESLDSIQ